MYPLIVRICFFNMRFFNLLHDSFSSGNALSLYYGIFVECTETNEADLHRNYDVLCFIVFVWITVKG